MYIFNICDPSFNFNPSIIQYIKYFEINNNYFIINKYKISFLKSSLIYYNILIIYVYINFFLL